LNIWQLTGKDDFMETHMETYLKHCLDELREATNFGLIYWRIIIRIVKQLVAEGGISLEHIGTTAEELERFEAACAAVVP